MSSYNILPLDFVGVAHPIMQLGEVKAAVDALLNIHGLTWPPSLQKQTTGLDLFDWLARFGFQRDNIRNQRENLILLLANSQGRLYPRPENLNKLDDRAIDAVMDKLFKSYIAWCKYMCREPSMRVLEGQQRKILDMGLYLLIWGEASNLRFMPECLSYIFHHMDQELDLVARENGSIFIQIDTGPPYGVEDESFLMRKIVPIYRVIEQEAQTSKKGKQSDSTWCNYDDLNNYFWKKLAVLASL